MLGITDAIDNGHAVVVDGCGYNLSTLYHHLNLGWSETEDAWYNLPTISTSNYNFNAVIETVYNIYPQGSGEIISGRVLDASGQPVSGATITATSTVGNSYTATSNSQGIYALAQIPAASTYTLSAGKDGYVFFPKTVKTTTSIDGNNTTGNLWGIDFVENLSELTLNQALDNDKLTFLTGGEVDWSGQQAVSFWAAVRLRPRPWATIQSSWLQTTVVGPGTLSFHWKVSSEVDFDSLGVFWTRCCNREPSAVRRIGSSKPSLFRPAATSSNGCMVKIMLSPSGRTAVGWITSASVSSLPLAALKLLLGAE